MNEQHRAVTTWLDGIYDSDTVPRYEVTPHTTALLHDLMKRNQRQDAAARLLIADAHQKTGEYKMEADRHARVISSDALSKSGVQSLQTLAATANVLDISEPSNTNILIAMRDLQQSVLRVKDERRSEQRTASQLLTKSTSAVQRYNSLKKALDTLNEQVEVQRPVMESKMNEMRFLHSKAKQYSNQVHQLETELVRSGVNDTIHHGALVRRSDDLREIRDKLRPMKAKLDAYHSLPPDVALTTVKVEEVRRELADMEEELAQHIDLMHL